MVATEIILPFLVTKEIFPIISNLGKARFGKKLFFPNEAANPLRPLGHAVLCRVCSQLVFGNDNVCNARSQR